MPVHLDRPVRALSQEEFGAIAFEVMAHAFDVHNQLGRFFCERVYQNAIRDRLPDRADTEVYLYVTHGDFCKPYRLDLLVDGGALFELKTVEKLHDRHRQQLIHYLMLSGLTHAKLVNFRPEQVEHEFVNCTIPATERRTFRVDTDHWIPAAHAYRDFRNCVTDLVEDWGTGLDVRLYREAVAHRYGGPSAVEHTTEVTFDGRPVGREPVLMLNPTTAFRITTLRQDLPAYESQLRRLLAHTPLERIHWANIGPGVVTFREVVRRN